MKKLEKGKKIQSFVIINEWRNITVRICILKVGVKVFANYPWRINLFSFSRPYIMNFTITSANLGWKFLEWKTISIRGNLVLFSVLNTRMTRKWPLLFSRCDWWTERDLLCPLIFVLFSLFENNISILNSLWRWVAFAFSKTVT